MGKYQVVGGAAGVFAALAVALGAMKFVEPSPQPLDGPCVVVIAAPSTVKAGELVVLSVEASKAASFNWRVLPETKNFLVIDGGKRAVFSGSVSGEYLFIVAGAKEDASDVKIHKLTIEGGSGPTPPTEDLSNQVSDWASKVSSPTKRDETLKLSQSFLSVAAIISSGVITTPDAIVEATKKANQDALGDKMASWTPFMESLQAELQRRAAAGHLNDSEAHAVAWRQIGEGLKRYAETIDPPERKK